MGFKGRRSGLNASLGLLVGGVTTITITTTTVDAPSTIKKTERKKQKEKAEERPMALNFLRILWALQAYFIFPNGAIVKDRKIKVNSRACSFRWV
jgi:hypothetical protein